MSAARVLAGAHDKEPEAFRRSEAQLVEAARIHTIGELQKVAAYWRQAVEKERSLDGEERLRARRRLHASVTFLGMVRVDGDLDPRAERRCSPRSGRCWTPSHGLADKMTTNGRRRSDGPTPWRRSAASGWIWPTDQRWPGSGRT